MVRGRLSVGTFLLAALCGCSGNGAFGESDDVVRGAIVGGATDSNDKPILGIYINEEALCSGTLIAPNLVLTARHCVAPMNGGENVDCATDTFGKNYPASGFLFTWNTDIRSSPPPSSAWVGATDVRTTTDTTFCGNDAAVIILDTNIPASTAPVIAPRVDSMPMTPESFKAIGYGLNSPNDVQGTSAGIRRSLGNLEVGCVGDECSDPRLGLATRITPNEWAANAPVCSGDSGGPALDASGKVIGIASRSDAACALGLYSAVAAFKDLIVDAGKDAADQGGYDPPAWTSGGTSMGSGGKASGGAGAGGAGGASAGKGGSSGSGGAKAGTGGTMGGNANAGTGGSNASAGMGNAGRSSAGRDGSAGKASNAGTGGTTSGNAGTTSIPTTGPGLGDECTSGCEAPYKCYSSTGKPPGECVPVCSATTKCPSAYRCDTGLGVCTPLTDKPDSASDDDDSAKNKAGCGCRVTPVSDATASAWHALGALALAAAAARRRRRSPRA
jgi:MYXO-CTERM domain-containing protein